MALIPGLYNIRFVPVSVQPPFLGGLYATAKEVGSPVLAEAKGPSTGLQTVGTIPIPEHQLKLIVTGTVGGSPP